MLNFTVNAQHKKIAIIIIIHLRLSICKPLNFPYPKKSLLLQTNIASLVLVIFCSSLQISAYSDKKRGNQAPHSYTLAKRRGIPRFMEHLARKPAQLKFVYLSLKCRKDSLCSIVPRNL